MRGAIKTYRCVKECQQFNSFEKFAWEGDVVVCPKCKGKADEVKPPDRQGFHPLLNEAIGVHPSQVAEHRRLHPDIPMTDDGAVIIRSMRENVRICKKLGYEPK